MPHNSVYIATSLDGYIADAEGSVGFLDTFPFPEGDDMGYAAFMSKVDALLMGRKTFETVLSFGVEWPYSKPVFVWSQTISKIPEQLESRVRLVTGDVHEVLLNIHAQGFNRLYIDGGQVIQSFLREDLIDEMILTTIPVVLGGGIPLFGKTDGMLRFRCAQAQTWSNGLAQCRYKRLR